MIKQEQDVDHVEEADALTCCEWCDRYKHDVKPFKDPEEGVAGAEYDVCGDCRKECIDKFCEGDEDHDDDLYFDEEAMPVDHEENTTHQVECCCNECTGEE